MRYVEGKYYYFIHGEFYVVGKCVKEGNGYGFPPIARGLSFTKARDMVYELNGWNKKSK